MGFLDGVRKTLANVRSGQVDPCTLTPDQRARYDAEMQRVAAAMEEVRQGHREASELVERRLGQRALRGPAADLAYGVATELQDPDEAFRLIEERGPRALVRQQLSLTGRQFREVASELVSGFPQSVDDPDERLRIERSERRARDDARRSYVAPSHPGVTITRIATRGTSQLDDVVAHLVASGLGTRPDLVFGVSRVPDRISPGLTPSSERGRIVEWDVVHEPVPHSLPVGGEVAVESLSAWDHWVRRSIGEPAVVDEELGVALCQVADVRARDCFGVARAVGIRATGGGDGSSGAPLARVEGVHVLAARPMDTAVDGLTRAAPIVLPRNGRVGVHVEVLNWRDIALAVHPQAQKMHVIPSPCPYLPSTPQELLAMYLEVVGVRAAECYAAAVTIDEPTWLTGVGDRGFGHTNLGGDEMCADGKVRRRLHGATHVAIAYEDAPSLAEGRERWHRYEDEVLRASLDRGTGIRESLTAVRAADVENPCLRVLARGAAVYDAIAMFGEEHEPPAYRYCLPLVSTR